MKVLNADLASDQRREVISTRRRSLLRPSVGWFADVVAMGACRIDADLVCQTCLDEALAQNALGHR